MNYKHKILIVDDNKETVSGLKICLDQKYNDYKFRCAIATALPIALRSSIPAPISSIKAIARKITW
jgi:hypothetical protein